MFIKWPVKFPSLIKKIKQLLISFNALLLMLYIYVMKWVFTLEEPCNIFGKIIDTDIKLSVAKIFFSIILYLVVKGLSILTVHICECGVNDKVNKINSLVDVTNEYMPVYLGYIFVAVSINNLELFVLIYVLLLVLIYRTQIVAYNPMFCLFGYHYYKITVFGSHQSIEVFVISKLKNIKDYHLLKFDKLSKINEFTYMDIGLGDY